MRETPYLDWIDTEANWMQSRLIEYANCNSGSFNTAGIQKMAEMLRADFAKLGDVKTVALENFQIVGSQGDLEDVTPGPLLHLSVRPDAPTQILLMGHMDTVFPKDDPFQTCEINGNQLHGPGVADLKGGLLVMLTALKALERHPDHENIGYHVVLNPDEEISSPASAPFIDQIARQNHLGLIYEPALVDGGLVRGRKGSGNFTLVIRGRAAHAGRAFHDGRNAVVTASDLALKLHALNGKQPELTVNVATSQGGSALNVVPDLCILKFNARLKNVEQAEWLQENIQRILEQSRADYPDCDIQLHGGLTRHPKVVTPEIESLQKHITDCANTLSIPISWQDTGGCCDGNNLAAAGLPNIDTLGVRGANIHSDQEFMCLDSLTERAKLSALLLMRLASGDIKAPKKRPGANK